MGKRLSRAAIEEYQRDGYYFPVSVLSAGEAREYRERLELIERDLGGPLRGVYRIKPHLRLPGRPGRARHPPSPNPWETSSARATWGGNPPSSRRTGRA